MGKLAKIATFQLKLEPNSGIGTAIISSVSKSQLRAKKKHGCSGVSMPFGQLIQNYTMQSNFCQVAMFSAISEHNGHKERQNNCQIISIIMKTQNTVAYYTTH